MAFILNKDKGQRMWGGKGSNISNQRGGGGGSGAGGGGGISGSWVDENYVSKDYFNQLFKVKVAVRVLVADPSTTPATVISDTTTVRQDLLYPNEVPEPSTTTDEETGYVTSTTYSIDSIQVMGGLWTNSYLSALGQNSSGGGGGGGGSLNEPLSSINMAGLSAPGAAQDGQTVVWNQATGRWVYGSTGSGTVTSITAGTGLSGGTITGSGTIAIDSTYQTYISHGETAYGWGNHANAGYMTQSAGDNRYLTIDFFRSLFRAYTSGNSEVTPNAGDTSTIDNIKAMFGFWTNAYISALGQNSSGGGGGGGGSSTLAGLNDVALYPDPLTPANANDVLTYNGNGHWVNTSKSSFLSGYATTSDISDMATQTWVLGRGYITGISSTDVTTALGYTPLNSATTFWGQSVNNGVVNGSMTDVGNITFDGSEARRISPNGTALFIGNSDNTNWVYMADMASQSGDSYWKIYSSGYAHFKRIYLDANVYMEYNSTTGGVYLVGAGFYTDSFVSALGLNSSGGGGGSSTLEGLNDVTIGTKAEGDVLTYDSQTTHWVNTAKSTFLNGYATESWVQQQSYLTSVAFFDLTSHPTTLSGYGITDAYISNGTIYLGSNSITPVTTETDPTVPAWAKESTKPSYSFSELTSHPTTLSGYGITDALGSGTKFWGRTESNGVVSGDILINGGGSGSGSGIYLHNTGIGWHTNGTGQTTFVTYGYNSTRYAYEATFSNTAIFSGKTITTNPDGWRIICGNYGTFWRNDGSDLFLMFTASGDQYGNWNSLRPLQFNIASGLGQMQNGLYIYGANQGNATQSGFNALRIGNGVIMWDSTNNALKIQKADGTSANLYATGGVSALGMQAGVSSIDAMTFNYVTINNNLTFGATSRISHTLTDENRKLFIGNDDNSGWVAMADMCGQDVDGESQPYWRIYSNGQAFFGNVQATRFYLDGTRYLYVSNGTLYYYNGTSSKQVAFTN